VILEATILEIMTLDSFTLIIKSDSETDLPEIIGAINQKSKINIINSYLEFASKNRITKREYKFNREDCYGL
jgi:hypothetical protein